MGQVEGGVKGEGGALRGACGSGMFGTVWCEEGGDRGDRGDTEGGMMTEGQAGAARDGVGGCSGRGTGDGGSDGGEPGASEGKGAAGGSSGACEGGDDGGSGAAGAGAGGQSCGSSTELHFASVSSYRQG